MDCHNLLLLEEGRTQRPPSCRPQSTKRQYMMNMFRPCKQLQMPALCHTISSRGSGANTWAILWYPSLDLMCATYVICWEWRPESRRQKKRREPLEIHCLLTLILPRLNVIITTNALLILRSPFLSPHNLYLNISLSTSLSSLSCHITHARLVLSILKSGIACSCLAFVRSLRTASTTICSMKASALARMERTAMAPMRSCQCCTPTYVPMPSAESLYSMPTTVWGKTRTAQLSATCFGDAYVASRRTLNSTSCALAIRAAQSTDTSVL